MPTAERGTTWHWLLRHERWLGRFAGRAGDPPPSGKAWCFQHDCGPGGTRLSWRARLT